MILNDFELASLLWSDKAVNGSMEFRKLSSNFRKQEAQNQKKYPRDFPKAYPVAPV